MKSKWLIASVLIVALIGLCAASLFATWQGVQMVQASGIHFRSYSPFTVTATTTEVKTLTVAGPANLSVENDMGNITVQTGSDGQVNVKADKTIWGNTEADAQAALKDLKVVIVQNGNDITITVQQPTQVGAFGIEPGGGRVKFTITVPKETAATLHSSNGDVSLDGTTGNADLQSDFGAITATNITGNLLGKSSNGSVTARSITSTGPVTLSSDFGDVKLDTAKGSDVTASSNNGKITLANVTAGGLLNANNQFGDIDISNSQAASAQVKSNNGTLKLDKSNIAGAPGLHSDFGTLVLTDVVAGSYDLTTQNGKIGVDGAQGTIKAHSDYGDVSVSNARNATIDLSSNNGAVTFSGSLAAAGPQSLSSDFGNIQVTLPADAALNVDLQTDSGKISSDFSLTIKGAPDDNHWVGSINGGGAMLTVKTNNGNIDLQSPK